jgi:chaperone modulatory protein CbpM
MPRKDVPIELSVIVIEDTAALTLADVCRACGVYTEAIIELIDEGVILPEGQERHEWRFTGAQLRRANRALRLQRDLGINLAGVALTLELLDELDSLRAHLKTFDEF